MNYRPMRQHYQPNYPPPRTERDRLDELRAGNSIVLLAVVGLILSAPTLAVLAATLPKKDAAK